jgi:multidrug efflux system outer membrane protein
MDIKRIFSLGAIILLAGCSMAPQYTRPDAPVPAAWPTGAAYQAVQTAEGTPAAADIPWREFFADERLQEVIDTALRHNLDLRLAAVNVQRARAMYGIQRAELFPTFNAVGSGARQRVPADLSSTGRSTIAEQYSVNLGILSWEIDFFGRIRSLEDSALESYLATEQARCSIEILIVSEVANAYLTLAAGLENLALAETTFRTQESAYDLIKRRYEVGVATELDLNRARTQVDSARRDAARYTQQVAQSENALNLLVGVPVPGELLANTVDSIALPKTMAPGISSEALLRRPDILQAENLLKAANANIGAARAALFPRISLTTTVGTASAELSGLFGAGSGAWLFAPQIAMPIFDARLWSALDVTKADKEITVLQYEKAIQTAFREVADTLAVQGTVDEQISAQQSMYNAAVEIYRLSDLRYTRGIDSYLSVLDAQRSLYAARQGLVALRLAKFANQVRMYAALGGGAE